MTLKELINKAKAVGYAQSIWTVHQGIKCPKCGRKALVFYCVADRTRPKVAACTCGWRKKQVLQKETPAPAADKKLKRCLALTQKGQRCKRIATKGGFCATHSR